MDVGKLEEIICYMVGAKGDKQSLFQATLRNGAADPKLFVHMLAD